jgi:hypothetical protein
MQAARNQTHFQKDEAHTSVASRQKKKKKKRAPRPPRRGYGGMEPLFAIRIRIKAPKRILLKVAYLASLFLVAKFRRKKNTHTHTLSLSLENQGIQSPEINGNLVKFAIFLYFVFSVCSPTI